jgi:hypothetical protein
MRRTNRNTAARLLPATAVATTIMAASLAGNALGNYFVPAPQVGHIIAFEPNQDVSTAIGIRLAAHRPGQSDCVLDLDVLHRSGGSLVVESQADGDGYHIHWAGVRTSADAADCGTDADLIVRRRVLDVLATYAGGYGADPDRMALYTLGVLK